MAVTEMLWLLVSLIIISVCLGYIECKYGAFSYCFQLVKAYFFPETKVLILENEIHWTRYFSKVRSYCHLVLPSVSNEATGAVRALELLALGLWIFHERIVIALYPKEFFENINKTIDEITDTRFSRDASYTLGRLEVLSLNSSDAYDRAYNAVCKWCAVVLPQLDAYIDLLQEENTIDGDILLANIFAGGEEAMQAVAMNLKSCLEHLASMRNEAKVLAKQLNGGEVADVLGYDVEEVADEYNLLADDYYYQIDEPKSQDVVNLNNLIQHIQDIMNEIEAGWLEFQGLKVVEIIRTEIEDPQCTSEILTKRMLESVKKLQEMCKTFPSKFGTKY